MIKKSLYPIMLRFALAFTLISILDDALQLLNYHPLNDTDPWGKYVLPLITTVCMELFYTKNAPMPNPTP
jgi:hypothetical protein